MTALVADTHALLWFLFDDARLSSRARAALRGADESDGSIALSSISLVKIVYLVEKGKLPAAALRRVQDLLDVGDTSLTEVAVDRVIVAAMQRIDRSAVPDLPDRVIAATALALDAPLVTKDSAIRESSVETVW